MKDDNNKKGLTGFFKKNKPQESTLGLNRESILKGNSQDNEKLSDFFSHDQMKNSQHEDLSELIKKIQIQKRGPDASQQGNQEEFAASLKQEVQTDKSAASVSQEIQNDDITEFFEIETENTQDYSSESNYNVLENSYRESQIPDETAIPKSQTENENISFQEIEHKEIQITAESAQTENSRSEIDKILGRIKKAETVIASANNGHSDNKNSAPANISSENNVMPPESVIQQNNIATESVRESMAGSTENIQQNNELNQSELQKILGRIKKAESKIQEPTGASQMVSDAVQVKSEEKAEEQLVFDERKTPADNQAPSDKVIKEQEEAESENYAEIILEAKSAEEKMPVEEEICNEQVSAQNISDDETDSKKTKEAVIQNNFEDKEPEKKPKKYTPRKTIWSEEDAESETDEDSDETGNIENKTLYSAKKTRWSDKEQESEPEIDEKKVGLVSVNDIDKTYSGLILPEGATFEIEEFKLKRIKKEIEPGEHDDTISKIDKIYSEYFPPIDLDKLNTIDLSETKVKEKKSLFGKIKIERKDKFEYNPAIHGSVVDLSFNEPEGVEEVDLYPVNEPFAYVRIIFDKNTNEYIYKAIEPVLNPAENKLLAEIEQRLFETLDVNTKGLTKEKAVEILKDSVNDIISDYGLKLKPAERAKILYHINKEFLGDGLIDPIMHDKYIEDISCDGLNTPIFVFHSKYESLQTNLLYKEEAVLDSFVTKLAQRAGKYISIAEPMLDATMSDGSRIQMTLGTEVTAHGSTFTIRKFKDEPITPTDLTEWGTFSPLSIAYIWLAVEAGKSCIFAGGTASGKTTSLNAISLFIPPLAKIVTLEDTRELKLPHLNWIPSVTRESFDKDGKGSIDMYELLRAALRQRPEYILVGEVRGAEAQTLFQAMSTGHVTYATMHADSVASAVHRIENPPLNVPRNMLSSLNLMSVQVQARIGGQRIRRNKQLIEILDIDPRTKELITNEVFKWHQSTDEIRYSGKSYVLEDIMESRGWDEARMLEELKRRQEILEWMRLKKLRNYKDVGKVLMSYYRDSEAVIKLVREDLYE